MTEQIVRTRPKNRREIIERAAAELFAERGFDGTGMSDVAERVGITSGAMYRHFSSKSDLLENVLIASLTDFVEAADAVTAQALPPDEALDAMLRSAVERTMANPARLAAHIRSRARITEEGWAEVRKLARQLFDRWSRIISSAHPELSKADIAIRERAINGAVVSLATRRTSVPAARSEELFATGLRAAMLSAPVARADTAATSKRTWKPPVTRQDEILSVSARLFQRNSYHGVGIDDIGEAAGIAGPTVYGTFPSKADILVQICDRGTALLGHAVRRGIMSADSAPEAFAGLVHHYATDFMEYLDLALVTRRESESLPPGDLERINRWVSGYREAAAAVLREVRDDLTEAESADVLAAALSMVDELCSDHRMTVADVPVITALAVSFAMPDVPLSPHE